MPVKRSLKLDDQLQENSYDPSKITRKKSITTYSPTTGTCQMSPFSSPTCPQKQECGNGPSNGKRKKLNQLSLSEGEEPPTEDNDKLLTLLAEAEKSSEEITEIRQHLNRIMQALEGNKELENLLGVSSRTSCFLKGEIQKTKELVTKVTKRQLLGKRSSGPPRKELRYFDSYEFLHTVLNSGQAVLLQTLYTIMWSSQQQEQQRELLPLFIGISKPQPGCV